MMEQEPDSGLIEEYESGPHANGQVQPNIMRIAELADREWTEIHEDPSALYKEMLGPGDHVLDIFMRTNFQDENELRAHVRAYARSWYRMKREGLLRGHPMERLPLRVVVAHLKERGYISMYGDGRYEALQAMAGVVVADRTKDGHYRDKTKSVGRGAPAAPPHGER